MSTDALIAVEDVPAAVWSKLSDAANDPSNMLRPMAVATISIEGKPCNRTLVLRGVDQQTATMWFHTDKRSPKMRHLQRNPFVSALGYDARDRVQIRLDGRTTLHHDDALADRHWEQVSLAIKYAYAQPHGPGEPMEQHDPRSQAMLAEREAGQPQQGRENFVVIEVHVDAIDWLQLSNESQTRVVLRAHNQWKPERLTP